MTKQKQTREDDSIAGVALLLGLVAGIIIGLVMGAMIW